MGFSLSGLGRGLAEVGEAGLNAEMQRSVLTDLIKVRADSERARDEWTRNANREDKLADEQRHIDQAKGIAASIPTDITAPTTAQKGIIASAGLGDADYRGDEGVGVDVQARARPLTETERARAGEAAALAAGNYDLAKGYRDIIQRIDEGRRWDIQDKHYTTQATENERHNRETVDVQRQHLGLEGARLGIERGRADMENKINQIKLDNVTRVNSLQNEYRTASPERQRAIQEEVQLLTGKDNDKYLPVPLKDDMGNVTGYKIFDTKRGAWVENAASSANDPLGLRQTLTPNSSPTTKPSQPVPKSAGIVSSIIGPGLGAAAGEMTDEERRRRLGEAFLSPGAIIPRGTTIK